MATFATVPPSCPLGPVSDQQFSGVVLLVEDEPLVRLVTADILLEANFRVIEAADAAEALRVLSAEVAVDVLLSDVEMPPGMNGYELARHVHQHRPEVEILIASGREWPGESDLPPGAAFLPKPQPNATLVSRVQAAARKAQETRLLLRKTPQEDPAAGISPEGIPKTA